MTRNLPLVLFATVALLTISHAYAQPANDSGTTRPLYTAKQRVVYTDGNYSRLMRGDPEEHARRYVNTALPVLLQEGWRIASVTSASNGSSHEGKTIIVLEIEAFPYDRTITVFKGSPETFPETGIGVRIERQKQGRRPGVVMSPRSGRDTRDTFQLHITGDGPCKHMTPDELRTPRKLDVGYFIQIVGETTENELQGLQVQAMHRRKPDGANPQKPSAGRTPAGPKASALVKPRDISHSPRTTPQARVFSAARRLSPPRWQGI